jgi:hypothetical protein
MLFSNVKEKVLDEQKQILVKNYRKIYAILIALFESLAIMRYSTIVGSVLALFLLFYFLQFLGLLQNRISRY